MRLRIKKRVKLFMFFCLVFTKKPRDFGVKSLRDDEASGRGTGDFCFPQPENVAKNADVLKQLIVGSPSTSSPVVVSRRDFV